MVGFLLFLRSECIKHMTLDIDILTVCSISTDLCLKNKGILINSVSLDTFHERKIKLDNHNGRHCINRECFVSSELPFQLSINVTSLVLILNV